MLSLRIANAGRIGDSVVVTLCEEGEPPKTGERWEPIAPQRFVALEINGDTVSMVIHTPEGRHSESAQIDLDDGGERA